DSCRYLATTSRAQPPSSRCLLVWTLTLGQFRARQVRIIIATLLDPITTSGAHGASRRSLMALITLRQLLDHAAEHGYGVPAFNVNNMEQVRAIMEAADETDSPVILQASAGARKYAGASFLRHLIQAAVEEWPHIPIVMHQDH